MMNAGTRTCDICDELIPFGAAYRVGVLPPEIAATLLETDRPELVPTWTPIGAGFVQLDICAGCHRDMKKPTNTSTWINRFH